jgi:hypothetical protein
MPYQPGAVDRSGEFMGQGIASFGGSIGNALERFSEEKEAREKEAKFQFGLKKALRPRWRELGFESEAEFDNADTKTVVGMAKGAIESQAIAGHEQQRQLTTEKLQQLQQSRAGQTSFNRRVSEFMSGPHDVQPPEAPRPRELTPEILSQFAAEANLAPEDMMRVSQAIENFAQAGREMAQPGFFEDPVSGMRFAQLRRQLLPSGINPERANFRSVVDPETGEAIPGVVQDPRGAMRNLPADRSAQRRKASVEAIVEAEKALQALDQEIAAYHSRAERAKRDANTKAFPESRLQELMKRKARLEKMVEGDGTDGADETNDNTKILAEAQDAIARGADPEKVRQRLKEKYGITLK